MHLLPQVYVIRKPYEMNFSELLLPIAHAYYEIPRCLGKHIAHFVEHAIVFKGWGGGGIYPPLCHSRPLIFLSPASCDTTELPPPPPPHFFSIPQIRLPPGCVQHCACNLIIYLYCSSFRKSHLLACLSHQWESQVLWGSPTATSFKRCVNSCHSCICICVQ